MATGSGVALRTRSYRLQGKDITVPDVQFVSQNPPSMYCVVASMKMSWDFIRATLGVGRKPEDAPELSFEAIRGLTRTDEHTGTALNDDLTTGFNAVQGVVDARLVAGITQDEMSARAARGLPVVALYYISIARDPEAEVPGVGHACVYLGGTDLRVVIHNPWLGPFTEWPAKDFNWSRYLHMDHAIVFDPKLRKARQRQITEDADESRP